MSERLSSEELRAAMLAVKADASEYRRQRTTPLPEDWMRVAPGTDAAIWRPWSRETGEL